jgi:hypothetical protein
MLLHLLGLRLRPGLPNPTGSAFPCCPLIYSLPCRNPGHPHPSTLEQIHLGGGGGSRTRVQNTFPSASYSNIFILLNYYLEVKLNLNHSPFVCKWFAFGLVFRNLTEFFLFEFRNLFGIVVEASLVQFSYQLFLFHGMPLLVEYL